MNRINQTSGSRDIGFADFILDPVSGHLRTARGEHIALRPRSLAVLRHLARSIGTVVSKDSLISTVWHDVIVTEDSLTQCIADIRRTIGDREHRIVRTVPRRGYLLAPASGRQGATVLPPPMTVVGRGHDVSPPTQYARSGSYYIAYQVTGKGPIDLVFVQGYVTQLEIEWEDARPAWFYERLSSFARLIRFDKRGTGLSDRVSSPATLEERMDDVRAVMDAAGSKRAVVLGSSEGGPMSILFAATYPERVSSLILYGAMARAAWAPDNPWGRTDEDMAAMLERHEALWGSGHSVDRFAPSIASDPDYRRWRGRVDRAAATPGAVVMLSKMNHAIDVRHLLPTIKVPTLVLHRAEDQAVAVEHSRYVASHIPGAHYVEMVGRDHAPWVADTETVCREIQSFAEKHHAAPQPEQALVFVMCIECLGETGKPGVEEGTAGSLVADWLAEVRTQLSEFHGREVKPRDAGIVAVFDGPVRAIRCALSIVKSAKQHACVSRAGIHLDAYDVWRDGIDDNLIGLCESVALHGMPGDVMITASVGDLVAGSTIDLEPKGDHQLKGFPGLWTLLAAK